MALGGPVLVPGIVVVDGPALFRHPRLGRLLSALLGRSGMVHARPTQLIALHCSLRRSCDRQPWGRVSLGAQPSLGGWVAFGLEPSSLLESGSGAFLVMGPGGLRWSRDAPRICRPMRLDDSTLSAARYWFILPLGMYIFTTSMPSFYYYCYVHSSFSYYSVYRPMGTRYRPAGRRSPYCFAIKFFLRLLPLLLSPLLQLLLHLPSWRDEDWCCPGACLHQLYLKK